MLLFCYAWGRFVAFTVVDIVSAIPPGRFGEGQRARNRIVMTLKQREKLREEAIKRGESVDDWDKIPLVGKNAKSNAEASEGGDDAVAT